MKKLTSTIALSIGLTLFSAVVLADGHAKKQKFTECVAVRMKEINSKHLSKADVSKYATKIPDGWTVISGTGGDGHPKLLMCR